MIEVIYNEENTLKEDTAAIHLPKNIRQIGQIGENKKIYVEDYVITYLNRLSDKNMDILKVAILLGEVKSSEHTYLFINGAIEIKSRDFSIKHIHFNEEIWSGIYEIIKEYFSGMDIVGWFLSVPGYPLELNDEIMRVHLNHFAGANKVLMMSEPIEREDAFFLFEKGSLMRQSGYYIYYEKNEAMQNYMIDRNEIAGETVKEDISDEAAKHFRAIIQEKKLENQQRKMMAFMYTASTFLVLVVVVIGVTMINNYNKMKNMEVALLSISENVKEASERTRLAIEKDEEAEKNLAQAMEKENKQIVVESIEGNAQREEEQAEENKAEEMEGDQNEGAEASAEEPGSGAEKEEEASAEEPKSGQEEKEETDTEPQEEEAANQQPKEAVEAVVSIEKEYYTVQRGDTLADISRRYYNTPDMVEQICELNHIQNVDRILVGQKIVLP